MLKVQKKLLPDEVVAYWPEVFEEVSLNVIPLLYLHSVVVNFKDNKAWEIKLTTKIKKEGWDSFQQSLSELLTTYEEQIDDVDFKLDAVKVKKDVEKSTNKFFRKNKL
jgi:hypothetical protein